MYKLYLPVPLPERTNIRSVPRRLAHNTWIESNVEPLSSVTITLMLSVMDCESYGISIVFDVSVYVWPFWSAPLEICIAKKKILHYILWPLSQKFSNSSISYNSMEYINNRTVVYREIEYITITYAIKSYFIYDFIISEKVITFQSYILQNYCQNIQSTWLESNMI